MTIVNGYATLAEARAWLSVPAADTSGDSMLEDTIETVSRWIDDYTGRYYYTSTTQARTYKAENNNILFIDDLVSVNTSGFVTDDDGDRTYENTWATTDYDLMPENAAAHGHPYTWVEVSPNGTYSFPTIAKGTKITGTWGWTAVPATIKQACLMQVNRMYNRKDAVYGLVGSDTFGNIQATMGLDADVTQLLNGFRKAIG